MESKTTILGKTGLRVSRIAVGSSYGIGTAGLLEAFDQGINFFYFGSRRTQAMADAIRQLAGRRKELVIAIQSYARWGSILSRSVEVALKKLGQDYADILILGMVNKPLRKSVTDAAVKLKESGTVRFLCVSAHNRLMFAQHLKLGIYDILMTRYNAAHTGSEKEVFPLLPAENRPGVIAYTATRWGTLLQEVAGESRATAQDCYRFVLNHPSVDVCMSGPKNRHELKDAIAALHAPPMAEDELARMRRIGKVVYQRQHHNFLLRKLIFD
ncbi:MAG TPA: hypothetical protein VLR94_02910 [Acidobacteriota bacterium]|nr:hypothetical protein [Acidobacteriota bacterium]